MTKQKKAKIKRIIFRHWMENNQSFQPWFVRLVIERIGANDSFHAVIHRSSYKQQRFALAWRTAIFREI